MTKKLSLAYLNYARYELKAIGNFWFLLLLLSFLFTSVSMSIRLFFLFITIPGFGCSDQVPFSESDLLQYKWLSPFYVSLSGEFISGSHNIDLGHLNFSYRMENVETKSIIVKMDSIALVNGWAIIQRDSNSLKLSKDLEFRGKVIYI